jgi:hypothetical protein
MGNQAHNRYYFGDSIDFLQNFKDNYWPEFFVLNGVDEGINSLSPISIAETLEDLLGETEDIRRLNSRSLLVQCRNKSQSERIQSITSIDETMVQITPHKTLNSCKGVILSDESSRCTDDQLRKWLMKKYGISEFQRMKPRSDGSQVLVLTFPGKILPKRIKIGFERCKVRPYVPNPRRCYNCQRFGHMSRTCRRKAACSNCGSENHSHTNEEPCKEEPHCVNCEGRHPSYERNCPKWKTEKNVLELKVTKNISFPEARRHVEKCGGQVTYAGVASTTPHASQSSPSSKKSDAHIYQGPRSSPRSTPRRRIDLPEVISKYSMYVDIEKAKTSSNDHFGRVENMVEQMMDVASTAPRNNWKRKSNDTEDLNIPASKIHAGKKENDHYPLDSSFVTVDTLQSGEESEEENVVTDPEKNTQNLNTSNNDQAACDHTKVIPEKETVVRGDSCNRANRGQQPDASVKSGEESYASVAKTPPKRLSQKVSKGTTGGKSTKKPIHGNYPKNDSQITKKSVNINRTNFKSTQHIS